MHAQRGIAVVGKPGLRDVEPVDDQLFQRFIANPMLLEGDYKFTMRCYVLFDYASDRWYLHKRGKLYHCCVPFAERVRESMVTSGYIPNEHIARFPYTFEELEAREFGKDKFDRVWRSVVSCVEAFAANMRLTDVRMERYKCMFLGLDVELDDTFRAWLLDVNNCPDMVYKNATDMRLKDGVIADCMSVIKDGVVPETFVAL